MSHIKYVSLCLYFSFSKAFSPLKSKIGMRFAYIQSVQNRNHKNQGGQLCIMHRQDIITATIHFTIW